MSMLKQSEVVLVIEQMHCASCVQGVEDALCAIDGVVSASVNFATGHAKIGIESQKVSTEQLIKAIGHLGYEAHPLVGRADEPKRAIRSFAMLLARVSFSLLGSAIFLAISLGAVLPLFVQFIVAAAVQGFGGWPFYLGTWGSLRRGSANMDTLVALGTSTAFGYSSWILFAHMHQALYFDTSTWLVTMILIGRVLEARAKRRGNRSMRALLELQPRVARIRVGEIIEVVPLDRVRVGDHFVVRPGEKMPVDGTVVQGEASVDEAMLTGESLPLHKGIGSAIYAGTINLDGFLEAETKRTGEETALGRIISMVERAQNSKAPIQRLTDRVTAWFVPVILGIAAVTFGGWWGFAHALTPSIVYAVAVLVIACPCALGLATPTVIMVAGAKAAEQGVVVKDMSVFERAQKMQALVIDKTGTVTEGRPQVERSQLFEGASQERCFAVTAALCERSNHITAQAILASLHAKNVQPAHLEAFTSVAGKGVSGRVDGEIFYLGSAAFLQEQGIALNGQMAEECSMLVLLGKPGQLLGCFTLVDRTREGSVEAIRALHRRGIKVFLLSGDRKEVTQKIAQELEIVDWEAQVLPEQKQQFVEKVKQRYGLTGMVGDGMNDAPALAAADIGFAIGSGADAALQSASVILMRPHIGGVVDTIELARLTFAKIAQNLIFAFGYNLLAVPIAAVGLLPPVAAGAAMALSSLSVVLNALSLQRKRKNSYSLASSHEYQI